MRDGGRNAEADVMNICLKAPPGGIAGAELAIISSDNDDKPP